MSDVVIRAEGLGKRYLIGHQSDSERYTALRDVLIHGLRGFARTGRDIFRSRQLLTGDKVEEFWALKDVSFEVNRGEVIGIIGRNGAGKSTLLKILSRITQPSAGRVTIKGRVASMLEVGTGFHPELTGRENIYLNGAILGMTRGEVRQKFDVIVAFAEVEKFLDTPVKRYSSGMYVRLAFAVAAHLEPEILIVDEVLSVGDAEFQNKCLGRINDVSKGGRTVVLVSHNISSITTLCTRGILLNRGIIECQGEISSVAGAYSSRGAATSSFADLSQRGDRSGSNDAQFLSIELLNKGQPCRTFAVGEQFVLKIKVGVTKKIGPAVVQSIIVSSDGIPVHELVSANESCHWRRPRAKRSPDTQ